MSCKLSIITVSYQNLEGLKYTAKSIWSQSFLDFEWIVIDGGSTDGTKEFLSNFAHPSYWCSEPDEGIFNAMNKGLKQACGDYFLFLNSGDFLASRNVLRSVFCRKLTERILCGGQIYYNQNNHHTSTDWSQSMNTTASDLWKMSLFHQATFIHRSLFTEYGCYNERYKIVADWLFFYQAVVLNNVHIQFLPIVVCYYESNGLSANVAEREAERVVACDNELPLSIVTLYRNSLYRVVNNYVLKCNMARKVFLGIGYKLFPKIKRTMCSISEMPEKVRIDIEYLELYNEYHSNKFAFFIFVVIRVFAVLCFKTRCNWLTLCNKLENFL